MIEGLSQVPAVMGETLDNDTDAAVERIAIAGVTAIQRIVADRHSLRARVTGLEQEVVALNATNKELRGRIVAVRHYYIELATVMLGQLGKFDRATRDAMQNGNAASQMPTDDLDEADLLALAKRLKPDR